MLTTFLFLAGLVLLIVGAEALVRGASKLATALGISPLVIGLTVVAFGTSSPELAVSVQAAFTGGNSADIALGNVLGSNIFNVLFILGLAAIITPLVVAQQLIRLDVPILIGVSLLTWGIALDGHIGRLDGALLTALGVGYVVFAIYQGRKEPESVQDEYADALGRGSRSTRQMVTNLLFIAAGLGMLVIGSRWLVDGAVAIATVLNVSELIISLTIIAAGTSLPEVATSVLASVRGQRDIAVGNVIGSNIFNLMFVLGISAAVSPGGIGTANALGFDLPVMVGVALITLPIFFTGAIIARWEGSLFFILYLAYTGYLILRSIGSPAMPLYQTILWFAIPAIVLVLAVTTVRQLRGRG
jgi:cation:H+ antiporter